MINITYVWAVNYRFCNENLFFFDRKLPFFKKKPKILRAGHTQLLISGVQTIYMIKVGLFSLVSRGLCKKKFLNVLKILVMSCTRFDFGGIGSSRESWVHSALWRVNWSEMPTSISVNFVRINMLGTFCEISSFKVPVFYCLMKNSNH